MFVLPNRGAHGWIYLSIHAALDLIVEKQQILQDIAGCKYH